MSTRSFTSSQACYTARCKSLWWQTRAKSLYSTRYPIAKRSQTRFLKLTRRSRQTAASLLQSSFSHTQRTSLARWRPQASYFSILQAFLSRAPIARILHSFVYLCTATRSLFQAIFAGHSICSCTLIAVLNLRSNEWKIVRASCALRCV